MNRRWVNPLLAAVLVLVMADSAHAQFGIGPFVFSFASPVLAQLFLLPFALVGCG